MAPLVVLDACTILNLLRIDDEDSDFLLKLIMNWRVCLPETVFKESKLHVRSDFYTKEKNDHIQIVVNREFDYRKTMDSIIKKDLDDDFERIIQFSGHNKRENGELYCVALALVKSREEEELVSIYTDDYKAIEEFQELCHYHRIGEWGDTLDLLTLLYWLTPETVFQNSLYYSFLENLRAEYNHQLKDVADAIDAIVKHASAGAMSEELAFDLLSRGVLGIIHQNLVGTGHKRPVVQFLFANPDATKGDQTRNIIKTGNINIATTIEIQMTRMSQRMPLFPKQSDN